MNESKLQDAVVTAASRHADRAAVTFDRCSGAASCVSLSYKHLVAHSRALASSLRNLCRENNGLIGLILQASAAYVPLNPDVPAVVSTRIMSLCRLKYCTLQSSLFEQFQKKFSRLIAVEVCTVWADYNLTLVRVQPLPSAVVLARGTQQEGTQTAWGGWPPASSGLAENTDLAYVLHTSGTTGVPKIVRVPHKCIVPNIQHLRSIFQMSADDLVFLASPLTFDPSVVEIFLALSSGARLLIGPSVIKKAPNRLAKLLFKDHKTTVLQVTPTLLGRFGRHTLTEEVLSADSSLRVLALGGEACPSPGLLQGWRQEGNRTELYNIYGITEVSCWACCHRVPEELLQSPDQAASSIPIGAPLLDTRVEVRDDRGCVITEGQGQRVCLIDGESTLVPGTMRATGDWVRVEGQHLHYLGRRDRLVKRHGQRVNLDTVQQVMMSLPQVESCAVGLFQGSRLVAFVVAPPSVHQVAMTPRHEGDRGSSAVLPEDQGGGQAPDRVLRRAVLQQLSLLVPSADMPDSLVQVAALPLTAHGKVDMAALMRLYQQQKFRKDSLGLPEDAVVEDDAHFLFSGGDSLKALCLWEDIVDTVGLNGKRLLEVLLEGSFAEVVRHVASETGLPCVTDGRQNAPVARKRSGDHPVSQAVSKRERSAPDDRHGSEGSSECRRVKVLRRAGQVLDMNVSDPETVSGPSPETTVTNIKTDSAAVRASEAGVSRGASSGPAELESGTPELHVRWSSDTGRCVDASPLLVVAVAQDRVDGGVAQRTTVFIGSHSHRMQALDLHSGELLWERVLGDRIESSAVVTRCGSQVASGATRWVFETGDAVKSSPTVDPASGLARQCVWRHHCGGGAVFSSPYLEPAQRRLYAASLSGHLDSGEVLWTYTRETPFFSSPCGAPGCVVIGSVDGQILSRRVLCGAHDGCVYCLDTADGSPLWSFQTPGRVYASPCTFQTNSGTLSAVASTDGTVWILDVRDGRKVATLALPGELFSSPVAWERTLVVGCRNNMVYCLELTEQSDREEPERLTCAATPPGTADT
ncbi:hypothetical protein CRUP_036226 [Coryphaenoides rupestris]|nr:hypothetical protein CRUP_036226 [Coryphaenoides rupestris]